MSSPFSWFRLPRTVSSLQRMREIGAVVARYGFEDVVVRLRLESTRERIRSWLHGERGGPAVDLSRFRTEQRIRLAFEELGPTFVKLGQILATRPDLVPMSLVRELRTLQDAVPPFATALARATVEEELGRPIEQLFSRFDDAPLAAASIAQVHRAWLPDGRAVVVKIRRPGLERAIATDLDVLAVLADLVEANVPESRGFALPRVVAEFSRAITREIDLRNERAHLERFASLHAGDPFVHVPEVHAALSTARVLTLEWIDGIKISNLAQLDAAGVDRRLLSRNAVEFVVRQVFEHGFFHADPHPGNLFVLPGTSPRIAPIDMGMMGVLDRETRDDLLELLVGLLMRDGARVVRLFQRGELIPDDVDGARLRRELQEFIDQYWARPLGELDIGAMIGQLFDVLTRFRVTVPPELFLMGKAMATVEGIARDLDPMLDPLEAMRPRILRLYLERLADPRFLARDWLQMADELLAAVTSFPGDARRIVRDVRRGRLRVALQQDDVREAARERSRSGNRQSLAIVLGALLAGSALLLASGGGIALFGVPITVCLGLAGLGVAGTGALVLAVGILRSGGL